MKTRLRVSGNLIAEEKPGGKFPMKFLSLMLVCAGLLILGIPAIAQDGAPAQSSSAQSWSGTLVDADCRTIDATKPCAITESTKSFGIQTSDGKYYKLDGAGNNKVTDALKGKKGSVQATVKGTMDRSFIKVESVEIP